MTIRTILFAFLLGAGAVTAAVADAPSAAVQTTGTIEGVVTDQASGEPLAGATVVVTSPALQGSQTAITAVAGFGMMLRGSPERGEMSWNRALLLARGAVGDDDDGYRHQLLGLIAKATLLAKTPPPR